MSPSYWTDLGAEGLIRAHGGKISQHRYMDTGVGENVPVEVSRVSGSYGSYLGFSG